VNNLEDVGSPKFNEKPPLTHGGKVFLGIVSREAEARMFLLCWYIIDYNEHLRKISRKTLGWRGFLVVLAVVRLPSLSTGAGWKSRA
jgi:hypothetical protein